MRDRRHVQKSHESFIVSLSSRENRNLSLLENITFSFSKDSDLQATHERHLVYIRVYILYIYRERKRECKPCTSDMLFKGMIANK